MVFWIPIELHLAQHILMSATKSIAKIQGGKTHSFLSKDAAFSVERCPRVADPLREIIANLKGVEVGGWGRKTSGFWPQ